MKIDKKKLIIKIFIVIAVFIGVSLAISNDYSLYSHDIGKITDVSEKFAYEHTNQNVSGRTYTEKFYTQTMTAVLKNGDHKGQKVTLKNTYGKSQVYDTKYFKGESIFIDNIKASSGGLYGSPAGVKRDWVIASVTALLLALFLVIGGKEGALTILSLGLNMVAFYFVLKEYTRGHNILYMTIPMVILFTWLLLFFMYGRHEKTYLSFVSTLITIMAAALIATVAMRFSGRIDFDFMDYLNQPYDQDDATLIFLSELIIGCLGAVMDVVVTIVSTVAEITKTADPDALTWKNVLNSCRAVGDDVLGTMISLMLFTNIAADIPAFILYMRNGVAIMTILRYNVFFELARFLSGSIGCVLSIPIASAVALLYYRRKKVIA
ncbi:MAG: YibE/F family protein [Eubacteriales bacterium]|nr:YibE/F family protein [Eubacteriales bacterium]